MPHSAIHTKKTKKNLILFALILGWCALIFLITMVKIAHAHDVHDMEKSFISQRTPHQATMDAAKAEMINDSAVHQTEMDKDAAAIVSDSAIHQQEMDGAAKTIVEQSAIHQEQMDKDAVGIVAQSAIHRDEMAPNPAKWWENWDDKLNPEK